MVRSNNLQINFTQKNQLFQKGVADSKSVAFVMVIKIQSVEIRKDLLNDILSKVNTALRG